MIVFIRIAFQPPCCKVKGHYFFSVDAQWVAVSRALWDHFVLAEDLTLEIKNVVELQVLCKLLRVVSPVPSDMSDCPV